MFIPSPSPVSLCTLYYNKPTKCSCSQSILFHCRVTLHISGALDTHYQEYIKLYLQPPVQVILSLQLLSSILAKFWTWPAQTCRVTLHVSGALHTHHQEYILQPPVQVILSLQLLSSIVAKFWTWPVQTCRVTLHISGALHTHHQEYIKLYLQPPVQVMLSLQLLSSNVAKFGLGQSKLAGSRYMFRVLCTPIIRSTLNCIYSLRYRSYYRCSYFLPTWPSLDLASSNLQGHFTCFGCFAHPSSGVH